MSTTPNPPEFVEAVEAHLAGSEGQFNYDQMRLTFLDVDRFHRWARVVDRRRALEGAFLSSGCGFGGSLLAYHDGGCRPVVGVEVDATYARMAALRVEGIQEAEVLLVAPDPPLPFADASFEVIESLDVIEHTPDPDRYLAELRRVLAPGGLVLLVTPNRLWPVEQHLGFTGPPWLPVRFADRLFAALARVQWLSEDRRFRYSRLGGMRTQNLSLLALRGLAKRHGFHLQLLRPRDAEERADWPLPADRFESWLDHPAGRYLAPVKTLPVLLRKR